MDVAPVDTQRAAAGEPRADSLRRHAAQSSDASSSVGSSGSHRNEQERRPQQRDSQLANAATQYSWASGSNDQSSDALTPKMTPAPSSADAGAATASVQSAPSLAARNSTKASSEANHFPGSSQPSPYGGVQRMPSYRDASRAQKYCSFCLLAEFDIDKGSTLAYQYPEPTGHDPHTLAELMLPDGAHLRREDWTFFFLKPPPDPNADQPQNQQSAFDDSDDEEGPGRAKGGRKDKAQARGKSKMFKPTATEDLTFVINLVRTKHDTSVRRGAVVKAMCIGTKYPWIQVFKPLLLVALDRFYSEPGPEHLATLYNAINNLDLSLMPAFTREEKLVLRACDRRDLWEERFSDAQQKRLFSLNRVAQLQQEHGVGAADEQGKTERARSDPKGDQPGELQRRSSDDSLDNSANQMPLSSPTSVENFDSGHSFSNSIGASSSSNSHISAKGKKKDTRFYSTLAYYNKLPIPIHIPLTLFPDEVGEYSMIQLIQTFSGPQSAPNGPIHPHLHSNGNLTHPIILLFNAIATQKRVLFLGYGQAAHHVANHVLAAAALGSGCGIVMPGYAGRVFPYTNLTNLDDLEKVPAFIAGVTNPRFEDLNVWDVLFNTENGKVSVNKNMEPAPPLQPNPRPSVVRNDSYANKSLASAAGSTGIGHTATSQNSPDVGKTSTALGARPPGGAIEAKSDAADNLFMEDITAVIAVHCGEDYVRQRFVEYAMNFVRTVARHEEHFYGHTSLGPPSQPYLNGQLGSGVLPYSDREAELRDIQINAMRAEGWRGSHSYKLCRDHEAQRWKTRAISTFDCAHQIGRLKRSKQVGTTEVEIIFDSIAQNVQTPTKITELLSLLPSHSGGLTTLAFGIFHTSPVVRKNVVDILLAINAHPVGGKLLQGVNTFVKLALARAFNTRAEAAGRLSMTMAGDGTGHPSPTPTMGGAATPQGWGTPKAGVPGKDDGEAVVGLGVGSVNSKWGHLAPGQNLSRSSSPGQNGGMI